MNAEYKEFKTIDEQIEILKSRNLIINDEDTVKKFLLNNNYYRISGYSLTLRNNDNFKNMYEFQNIVDIYNCDFEMRHIMLKYLEIIEVRLKSLFAYEFSKLYDPYGYLDVINFTVPDKHREIIDKANSQKNKRLQHEAYLKHFVIDLQTKLPLWAYVDLLTISDISFLYKISKPELKNVIIKHYGFENIRFDVLTAYFKNMTILRNICAHGGRLYNRLFEQKPSLKGSDKKILIKDNDGKIDNAHLFSYILVMKRLIFEDEFCLLKEDIKTLMKKYSFVDIKYYGFRSDWSRYI